jgi:hypothetical protein
MIVLYKVDKTKNPESKNAWATAPGVKNPFMISDKIASVLSSNVLVVKGNVAILHGTPELTEVKNKEGNESRGFRLVGLNGKVVDDLAVIDAKLMSAQAVADLVVSD